MPSKINLSLKYLKMQNNPLKPTVLIITELFPYDSDSFIGAFVVNQIQALKKKYNFIIIVPRFFGFSIKKQISKQQDNVNIYYIRQYSFFLLICRKLGILKSSTVAYINKLLIRKKILKLAQKLHKKYNFLLIHGHESYIGDEAGYIGRQLDVPSIITIHGIYEYHKLGWGEKIMGLIIKNLNKADKILAVSKISLNSYQKNGLSIKNYEIIPNIINKKKLDSSPKNGKILLKIKKLF
ncbi:MAG: glycosyltransferase [bacterium]|nr:glycosyltransferase [bacterium]